jgi:outer membrane protein assembly factor BamB
VYTLDRQKSPQEVERVLCLDADTGETVWVHEYPVVYGKLDYGNGPRSQPTVADGRVYTLGALGHLSCLDATTGKRIWTVDTVADLKAVIPTWGFAASPVIYGETVIAHVGAVPNGCVVGFDKKTGKEIWRGGDDPAGYCTPSVVKHGGVDRLIVWNPEHIVSHSPKTGDVHWKVPYKIQNGVSIASPIYEDNILFVSGYWDGSKAIRLTEDPMDYEMAWEENRWLRGMMSQALYRDGYVFNLDKFHGLVCFELATGEKVWTDGNRMTPKSRNPQASMVWVGDGDRTLVLNSDGDLILARFTPTEYVELDRANIIGFTWAHPAFAGERVYARSDTTIVAVEVGGK